METVALLEDLLGLLKTLNETIGVPGESLSEKNVLQNESSDPNKKVRVNPILSSSEQKRTTAIATLFAKVFFDYKKKTTPDTALKTSVQKIVPKTTKEKNYFDREEKDKNKLKLSSLLMGAGVLAMLGGVGALITGLLTDGPFKGTLKILSKIGISGSIKLLSSGIKLFLKSAENIIKLPLEILSKVFGKTNFAGLEKTLDKIIKSPFEGISELFGKIGKSFANLIKSPLKVVGEFFGKSKLFGMAAKFFKPLAKVVKKLPLIGTIISVGFAISRFRKGDITGGVIDLLSAIAPALDLVLPGLGTATSIGIDIFNAWLDVKANAPENKGKSKINILGEMAKKIGKWIWDRSTYLPVIGGFKRWGMAWEAFRSGNILDGITQLNYGLLTFMGGGIVVKGMEMFMGLFSNENREKKNIKKTNTFSTISKTIGGWFSKNALYLPIIGGFKRWGVALDSFRSGNVMEGLGHFGAGLITFIGGGPIVKGIEMLMGLFGDKEDEKDLSPDSSWYSNLKKWIKGKLKKLPYLIRKPLEWFGILDNTSDEKINIEEGDNNILNGLEKIKNFSSSIWNGLGESINKNIDKIKGSISSIWNGLDESINKNIDKIKGSISSIWNKFNNNISNILDKIGNISFKIFGDNFEKIKDKMIKIKDSVLGFFSKIGRWVGDIFSSSKKEEPQKRENNKVIEDAKKKEKPKELTDAEKLAKAHEAGHPDWKSYKESNWAWLDKPWEESPSNQTINNQPNVPIIKSGNPEAVTNLAKIAENQLQTLNDIKYVAIDILKQIKGGIGGNANAVVPTTSQSDSMKKRTISLSVGRGEYGSSPYALA